MTLAEEIIENGYEDVILFESTFDEAFIGMSDDNRAIYSHEKMVECCLKDSELEIDNVDEAEDYISYGIEKWLVYQQDSPIVMFDLI